MRLRSFFDGRMRNAALLAATILGLMLALTFAPGRSVHAQDGSSPRATQTKFFVPWQGNMLNPALTVRSRENFMGNPILSSDCQAGAITTERPDAWRCGTADPCFAPFFGDRTTVACSSAPWSGEVVVLTLSRPLPTAEQCSATPTECPRPLDLTSPPWAVELANGAKCTALTGTRTPVAGMITAYGCDDGGGIAAPDEATFDKTLPLWRAFYMARDAYTIEQVEVLTVWR